MAVIAAFVIFALLQAGPTEAALNGIRGWLTSTFDWLFMGAANLFVLFSLFLIFSPMGSVVIGGQDAKPEYSSSSAGPRCCSPPAWESDWSSSA